MLHVLPGSHKPPGSTLTQQRSSSSSSSSSSAAQTSAACTLCCSASGTMPKTPTLVTSASHLAAARRCGGSVLIAQLVTHTAGKPWLPTGRLSSESLLATAVPSVLDRRSVCTTPLLSMLLLWQHSGVPRTQTSQQSTHLVVAPEKSGIVVPVARTGLPKFRVAPCTKPDAHNAVHRTGP